MAFSIKQNNTSPSLQVTLKNSSLSTVDLTGAAVRFHMKSVDGTLKIDAPMTVTNLSGGVCQYDWQVGDTDTAGTYYVEFEVTYADAAVETFPNSGSEIVKVIRGLN